MHNVPNHKRHELFSWLNIMKFSVTQISVSSWGLSCRDSTVFGGTFGVTLTSQSPVYEHVASHLCQFFFRQRTAKVTQTLG